MTTDLKESVHTEVKQEKKTQLAEHIAKRIRNLQKRKQKLDKYAEQVEKNGMENHGLNPDQIEALQHKESVEAPLKELNDVNVMYQQELLKRESELNSVREEAERKAKETLEATVSSLNEKAEAAQKALKAESVSKIDLLTKFLRLVSWITHIKDEVNPTDLDNALNKLLTAVYVSDDESLRIVDKIFEGSKEFVEGEVSYRLIKKLCLTNPEDLVAYYEKVRVNPLEDEEEEEEVEAQVEAEDKQGKAGDKEEETVEKERIEEQEESVDDAKNASVEEKKGEEDQDAEKVEKEETASGKVDVKEDLKEEKDEFTKPEEKTEEAPETEKKSDGGEAVKQSQPENSIESEQSQSTKKPTSSANGYQKKYKGPEPDENGFIPAGPRHKKPFKNTNNKPFKKYFRKKDDDKAPVSSYKPNGHGNAKPLRNNGNGNGHNHAFKDRKAVAAN